MGVLHSFWKRDETSMLEHERTIRTLSEMAGRPPVAPAFRHDDERGRPEMFALPSGQEERQRVTVAKWRASRATPRSVIVTIVVIVAMPAILVAATARDTPRR